MLAARQGARLPERSGGLAFRIVPRPTETPERLVSRGDVLWSPCSLLSLYPHHLILPQERPLSSACDFLRRAHACQMRGRRPARSTRDEGLGGTYLFDERLQIPHDLVQAALNAPRGRSRGRSSKWRRGSPTRAALVLRAGRGRPAPPQDQRRHVDLTELVHVIPIDRKHRPFHVVAPDVGRKLEALGDHRRKEFFRDQMVDRALLELPYELGRNGIFQRAPPAESPKLSRSRAFAQRSRPGG